MIPTKFDGKEGAALAKNIMDRTQDSYHERIDADSLTTQGEEWILGAFQYCWQQGSELYLNATSTFIEAAKKTRLESLIGEYIIQRE